ncbi:Enolase [Aduncisulcus paluster]|uniref:phosphopyruvate hydratase n=2 Tax=Aduncisulcus paluster TaxID=2918883 RepID=A0ABQ5KVX2_9EUKA|nr:Enolase [Aduncisulcus paluster]
MDVAASEFYVDGKYDLGKWADKPNIVTGEELTALYLDWTERYPIVSIEDPFDQMDIKNWAHCVAKMPKHVQIVADDLSVTQKERIEWIIKEKGATALLLKINQCGSITDSFDAVKTALSDKWAVMASHRSGETEDVFIAHLVVGLGVGQIKTGAPCRSERVAKYNEILRIVEDEPDMPYGFPAWK